jgi:hypothetical protein
MTIRLPNPKYAFLDLEAPYPFYTPSGRHWHSVLEYLKSVGPRRGGMWHFEDLEFALRLKFACNHDIRRAFIETGKEEIKSTSRSIEHWVGNSLQTVRRELQTDTWTDYLPWTPFVSASLPGGFEAARAMGVHDEGFVGIFINARYQVVIDQVEALNGAWDEPIDHLSIKRWDKAPLSDWREKQRIKNELIGPEREACEIFPAESRLVDTANQYHLWVLPKGTAFPFGFTTRAVAHPGANPSAPDAKQRPFENAPDDAMDAVEVERLLRESREL